MKHAWFSSNLRFSLPLALCGRLIRTRKMLELGWFLGVLAMGGGCRDDLLLYPSRFTDYYDQVPVRQVDVLLVVDNSGSMVEEQEKLAENFQPFITAFLEGDVDYHIGVTTTDLSNEESQGRLMGDIKIITRTTENAEAVFAENVQVGTEGSGAEMGLEAARVALSEPVLSTDNAGFLREEASLSIVIVSDEDDISPYSVDDYLNFFSNLKGQSSYRDHTLMNLSSVVGDVPYGCEASDGSGIASPGTRYVDASASTEGVFASICADDFSPIVEALGLNLSGLQDEFPLTRCAKEETLEVVVNGSSQTLGVNYQYVPLEQLIRFEPDSIPAPDTLIEIAYEFYASDNNICRGAEEESP